MPRMRWFFVSTLVWGLTASAQALVVTPGNSPYTIATDTTFAEVSVQSGATLVVNARLTVSGNMTVQSAGRVTVAESVMWLRLNVAGTLTIEANASVDADVKGLKGSPAAGFGSNGATIDPLSFQVVAGAYGSAGGSHATPGANVPGGVAASAYGNSATPLPGGGGGSRSSATAGAGGGVCELTAGALVLEGRLSANGGNSPEQGGGAGAGGSIFVTTSGAVSGSGLVSANGGSSGPFYETGSGAAGRIRIRYDSWAFLGAVSASSAWGGWGSVHLEDSANVFRVVTPVTLNGGESFAAILLGSGGVLTLNGSTIVRSPIVIGAGSSVLAASATALNRLTLDSVIEGSLVLSEAVSLTGSLTVRGLLEVNKSLALQNLDVEATGLVTHSPEVRTSSISASGAIRLFSGGRISASGKGLRGGGKSSGLDGFTIDPSSMAVVPGSKTAAGGSHAGVGGRGVAAFPEAATYDDVTRPTLPGGGGGGNYDSCCGTRVGGDGRRSASRRGLAGRQRAHRRRRPDRRFEHERPHRRRGRRHRGDRREFCNGHRPHHCSRWLEWVEGYRRRRRHRSHHGVDTLKLGGSWC